MSQESVGATYGQVVLSFLTDAGLSSSDPHFPRIVAEVDEQAYLVLATWLFVLQDYVDDVGTLFDTLGPFGERLVRRIQGVDSTPILRFAEETLEPEVVQKIVTLGFNMLRYVDWQRARHANPPALEEFVPVCIQGIVDATRSRIVHTWDAMEEYVATLDAKKFVLGPLYELQEQAKGLNMGF